MLYLQTPFTHPIYSSVDCVLAIDFKNTFTSAGINQTLHEIFVNVNATIYVIMPKNSATAEVNSNYCIAQTVIIGTVPETFADFQNKGEQNE